jgi:hypothetical protein
MLDASKKQKIFFGLGDGRCWAVRGRQWMEDMNRFPSIRLRVEFDGPDVSQEVLYELFRPYGRLADITPPAPVPAGNLRYAVIHYGRLRSAAVAINTVSPLDQHITFAKDPSASRPFNTYQYPRLYPPPRLEQSRRKPTRHPPNASPPILRTSHQSPRHPHMDKQPPTNRHPRRGIPHRYTLLHILRPDSCILCKSKS